MDRHLALFSGIQQSFSCCIPSRNPHLPKDRPDSTEQRIDLDIEMGLGGGGERNNPCVLLTHSLNFQYRGLHCPAFVNGHINLTAHIQSVLVKHHDCFYYVLYILIK
eukprot:sb/3477693/